MLRGQKREISKHVYICIWYGLLATCIFDAGPARWDMLYDKRASLTSITTENELSLQASALHPGSLRTREFPQRKNSEV